MAIDFPLGNDDFPEIRHNGDYYVDKTGLIAELFKGRSKVLLMTRPRRFGKTLAMSMLEDFFDISKDSKADFAGLEISENKELCEAWMNQWPVIFLTLKDVEAGNFARANERFRILMADLCKKYSFLGNSDKTDEDDRDLFKKIKSNKSSDVEACETLYLLTRMMNAHYGRPVILLLDEYDVPLARASEAGYYKEMIELVKALVSKAMKTNPHLKFAVVMGCLKIAKESIFTGTNNFVSDTIVSDKFDEYIGFTEKDVQQILEDSGFSDHAEEVRTWYDGYLFGSVNVYCPWDVLNHVAALQTDPDAKPEAYWANTSGNSILKRLLKNAGKTTKVEIEELIDGNSITKRISDQITYCELGKSMNNLWSVLYLTGYLTRKDRQARDGALELVIPNNEIREIFISHIYEWFTEEIVGSRREKLEDLCRALKEGDVSGVQGRFEEILKGGISIRDTAVRKSKKENFYHGVLLGLLMCMDDWYVHSNVEDGDGYSDIHVEIDEEDTAFVIEVKYAEENALEAGCKEAMAQIERMRYMEGLQEKGFSTVHAYGIACFKRHCSVVCRTVER